MKDDMLLNEVIAKARSWTKPPHDNETRNLVQKWLDGCATPDRFGLARRAR